MKILISIFMLFNLFNVRQEQKHQYYNAKYVKGNSETLITGVSFFLIENYNGVKGDILINLHDTYFHVAKAEKERKNKTKYGYKYRIYLCVTDLGSQVIVQLFEDKEQGIVIYFDETNYIHIY